MSTASGSKMPPTRRSGRSIGMSLQASSRPRRRPLGEMAPAMPPPITMKSTLTLMIAVPGQEEGVAVD
jgi:hypothetical protein